eukprot:5633528-Karenia_brevis.AAC.1
MSGRASRNSPAAGSRASLVQNSLSLENALVLHALVLYGITPTSREICYSGCLSILVFSATKNIGLQHNFRNQARTCTT